MSGEFDRAVNLILDHEGGYVNDPKDPGGETNFGISKRAYPNEDIRGLTKARAKEIYRKDYWNKIRGDTLPFAAAVVAFDIAVNMGIKKAVQFLQRTASVLDDGIFGDKTAAALSMLSSAHIAESLTVQRIHHYMALPNFHRFGVGWTRRSVETLTFALTAQDRI